MKKIIALALALIMVLSMGTVAFAAGSTVTVTDEATLKAALAAVGNGDTIVLANSFELEDPQHTSGSWTNAINYEGTADFTLDFNGNTLTVNGTYINNSVIRINSAVTVTLKNGTIDGEGNVFKDVIVNGGSTVNLDNMTLKLNRADDGGSNVSVVSGSTLNVNAGTELIVDCGYACIESNGVTNIYDGATITFGQLPGTVTYGSLGSAVGVSGGTGVINIYGGTITTNATGGAAVSTNTSGGTINIYGGEISGDIAVYSYTDSYYNNDAAINISGGEISGELKAEALGTAETEINVSGGTLDADAITTSGNSTAINIASTVTKTPATEAAIESAASSGTVNIDTVVPATNPGQKITIRTGIDRSVYKVKSYDFTTGTKGYKGASYIDEVKIEKNGDVVIVLKENYKLAEDKNIKGEVVLVEKADKDSTITIPVEYTVANNVVEVFGERKPAEANPIPEGPNTLIVMDEDGGYVTFAEEMLTGVVKMNKEEKTFLNIWYGNENDTTEEIIDAIEAELGEDYVDEAIIEYYTFETRAFKNEVAFSYEAYEDDPHYFYLYNDGKLTKIDATYDDDEDVEAWVWTAIAEGTIIVTDVEIVLADEATKNPDTGANDVVGIAAALAVTSLVAAAAISIKK